MWKPIVWYINLSLSPYSDKTNRKKRKIGREREREGGKTKKAEGEKYKNTENNKKKTSIFSRTLESRFRLVTFFTLDPMYSFLPLHPQIHPRLSVESLDASAKRFIPFLTTPTYFSFSFPSLLFSNIPNLVFLCSPPFIYPRLFRFERWFHVLRIRS